MKEKNGFYRGIAGFLYTIKAIKRKENEYDVYAKQISPALQLGWSYWGKYSEKDLKIFKIDD